MIAYSALTLLFWGFVFQMERIMSLGSVVGSQYQSAMENFSICILIVAVGLPILLLREIEKHIHETC